MQFGLAHRALQAEQKTIVEQRRVIHAVGVADKRVSHGAKVEQPVPVRIIARKARHLESENDASVSECDFSGHAREAAAARRGGPRKP
jgi:hypothetical protein